MSRLPFRIALRYFFSAKSHGAVNVISAISVAGVAVATAAIVIVLSVFNGFSQLTRSRFSAIDPDLLVCSASGKIFSDADSLASVIAALPEVAFAAPTLSEKGLIMSGDEQVGVVFKGVDSTYYRINDIEAITDYYLNRPAEDSLPGASVAVGVASALSLHAGEPIELYTLRRIGRINPAIPSSAFFSQVFGVDRILRVDQMEFDADHLIIPIDIARELLQYDSAEASAIEIAVVPGVSTAQVAKLLKKSLGPEFEVLTREQQNAESYRMIAVEKWVTFAMLIFILIIAAFNIISTLSLMVIEKRQNAFTLLFMGAPRSAVRSVFAWLGAIITVAGGIAGIIIGAALSLAQQWFGFVKLSGSSDNLSIAEYPVNVEWTDLGAVLALIIAVAILSALSTRLFTKKIFLTP